MNLLVRSLLILILVPAVSLAGPNDPITGADFDSLFARQNFPIQNELNKILADSVGYVITGPIDPMYSPDSLEVRFLELVYPVRVICPNRATMENAATTIRNHFMLIDPGAEFRMDSGSDYHGPMGMIKGDKFDGSIRLVTIQQARADFWWNNFGSHWRMRQADDLGLVKYRIGLREYLDKVGIDSSTDVRPPAASDFDIPESLDFYAPPPDYVIQGYQNYKDSLKKYSPIRTDFADGIVAFVPSDSLLAAMKENAPRVAYPNKEASMLQHEYKKFFDRGGDVRVMQTLSKEGLDTLQAGEYFFAVGLSGRIRFGRELLREEVIRIEAETGKKVPRANHAFLFPGQPILTAGAFFLAGSPAKLVKVNAQSGHYFYSNVSPTIQRDISVESDKYLMTLGHFFRSLDSLGIDYEMVLISKQ